MGDITHAHLEINAGRSLGDLTRPWTTFGYDELNWTYTPRGKAALKTFGEFAERPYHVRAHNLFTTGRAFSWPHWGSGNVYHEDANGNPYYDWTTVDRVFDAYLESGLRPLVELGFTPAALVPPDAELPFTRSASQYQMYEAALWSMPPRDYAKWGELIFQCVTHCVERYGREEVETWYWELWNEPDIFYWRGTPEQFDGLYDVTVDAATRALPSIKVGGPAVTGGPNATRFMDGFLAHCAGVGDRGHNAVTGGRGTRLDFISCHTKGSAFGRRYGPLGDDGAVLDWGGDANGDGVVRTPRQSPSRRKMLTEIRAHLRAAAAYPQFRHLPVIVDECDPCVPAHFSAYDNANFRFRNTPYYGSVMASVFKRILDLNEAEIDAPDVTLASAWAFYFEGERFFEGFREFFTAENVELPVLNTYRVLARLHTERVPLASDASWAIRDVDQLATDVMNPSTGTVDDVEIDGLATRTSSSVAAVIWHHRDDQYASSGDAHVTVTVSDLPFDAAHAQARRVRIDGDHSNAHAVWVRQGRPQHPTREQIQELRSLGALEVGQPLPVAVVGTRTVRVNFSMPLHSVSFIEVTSA